MTCIRSTVRRWLFVLAFGLCLSVPALAGNATDSPPAFCTAKDSPRLLKRAIEKEFVPGSGSRVLSIRAERNAFTLHIRYREKNWTFLGDEPDSSTGSLVFHCLHKDAPPELLKIMKNIGGNVELARETWRPCRPPDRAVSPHVSAPVSTGFALTAYFCHGLLLLLVPIWAFALRKRHSETQPGSEKKADDAPRSR